MSEFQYKSEAEPEKEGADTDLRAGSRGVAPLVGVHTEHLRKADPELFELLTAPLGIEAVRQNIFRLLLEREARLYAHDCEMGSIKRSTALHCIRVLKNIFSPRNERVSGHSALNALLAIVRTGGEVPAERKGLFLEIYHLSRGSLGHPDIPVTRSPDFLQYEGREGALIRSDFLDQMAGRLEDRIRSYRSGLEPEVVAKRAEARLRILDLLGGDREDWDDYQWHQRHVFRDADAIAEVVELTEDEDTAIRLAVEHRLPFGITPYYLSLFDREPSRRWDHQVRAQVIPPLSYVQGVLEARKRGAALDFMKEGQTSPVDLVTRRYPMIAILKPYNTCAQICVYCQRNWEIADVTSASQAAASSAELEAALQWFRDHPTVSEVLVTGGDPALLADDALIDLLQRVTEIPHVARVRIGTRLPVVLPMRFTERLVDRLCEFHQPPEKDLCLVTHFEHTYEVTPEALEAVQRLRRRGIGVYNQQVFTIENSRRFETAALRMLLKQIGVDPYYTFNTKGKEETNWYRVPIARILQERKEEARLLPGLSRTDEPVFNIPALGKNHLREWQSHDLIMISPRGERIYEFHPWEKNITTAPTYVYTDVPILDYLQRLEERGEDAEEYQSIWYYF